MMDEMYLVAIPTGSVLDVARETRDKINKEFGLYSYPKPDLHVTVEVLKIENKENLEDAIKIIKSITEGFSPFILEVKGFEFFPAPHKAITLAVKENYFVENLSFLIHEKLQKKGLTSRTNLSDWKFHITIAGAFGANREWSEEEFYKASEFAKDITVQGRCVIESLELWKPVVAPEQKLIKEFKLKRQAE